jgi:predicted metalloprotease
MRWAGDRQSSNIVYRRGLSGGHIAVGGGIGSLVIGLIIYLLGGNPSQVINAPTSQVQQSPQQQQLEDEYSKLTATVLGYTEDVWNKLFNEMNKQYVEPTLVMFTESTESGCGFASAATGPFYCPSDQKVYIDLSFFDEMKNRFGAGGDFAMAYVIAHEVGHHVQDLLGITRKVDALRAQGSETAGNRLSVKLELQADFLAGVWAHYTEQYKNNLEQGDIEEALNAANAIGDDRLQKEAQGRVVPDAFTHGTSEQRMYWFKKGYTTGDINQGDTFNDPGLR